MQHYRIIFLLLSSLVFSSCAYHQLASYKNNSDVTKKEIKSFVPQDKALKYKASIDVLNKHFTGLIVLKQTDSETKHLVFVTELGMRMFDLEWKGDSLKPVFVFEPLSRPKLVKALVRNFETMFLVKWVNKSAESAYEDNKNILHLTEGKKHMFFVDYLEPSNAEQWVFNKHKKETKTIYSGNYETIKLKQYGFVKIFIELEKIKE
jgi:hypothetical protein